ncbi:hypothetical protein N7519_003626 [Penicillium mononematosum]|uniref:uncharacterized protein n=1 Tax=Penicillium mononematosum TaxID=268346 RepID=UPI002548BF2E|nr:uncharacterized protein N7519_003626 [Penicillium mononematosum]KAJ6188718.1 hypothetical protein N7519_003626 [Penicillium mononematosum]
MASMATDTKTRIFETDLNKETRVDKRIQRLFPIGNGWGRNLSMISQAYGAQARVPLNKEKREPIICNSQPIAA